MNTSLRRILTSLVVLLGTSTAALGIASPADASDSAVARSFGMQCSAAYGWVRTNYPNISVGTVYNQDVYFRTRLQRYTASGWQTVGSSVTFHGVSNYTGRKALGYFGGQPYYFAYHTATGSYVAPERGPAYTNLVRGYYRTVETYTANGHVWSHVSGDVDNPGVSYCWA